MGSSAHSDIQSMVKYDYHQYEVIGRHVPTERDPAPKAYRIKLFTKNETQAKSRFWYFIRRIVKMKRANGEILSIREIFEKKPEKVSKYGIWVRYDSRSGTTNMYKEYTALSQNEAAKCIRANTKQFLKANISFPLPHRVYRGATKAFNKGTKAKVPSTFRG